MGRRGVAVFVFALVSGLIWTITPVRANAAADHEGEFVQRANAERAGVGLGALATADDLVAVARRHSQRMAAEDRLHHNPALSSEVEGWQAVAENVGVGASVESIHRAFMASRTHRDNLVSGTYTQVGMGVHVAGDGAIWVTQVFRKPAASEPAAAAPTPAAAEQPPAERKPAEVRAARAPRPATVAARPALVVEAPLVVVEAPLVVDAAAETASAEAEVAAMTVAFTMSAPATPVRAAAPTPRPESSVTVAAGDGERRVSLPIGVAASLLLAVVLGLLAEAGRYPLSDWRRQRSQASISSSRSPSSTAWTLPVS